MCQIGTLLKQQWWASFRLSFQPRKGILTKHTHTSFGQKVLFRVAFMLVDIHRELQSKSVHEDLLILVGFYVHLREGFWGDTLIPGNPLSIVSRCLVHSTFGLYGKK